MKRLVQDRSGHWYLIDADKWEQFSRWLGFMESSEDDYDGECFDDFRLNMHPSNYTFENWSEYEHNEHAND